MKSTLIASLAFVFAFGNITPGIAQATEIGASSQADIGITAVIGSDTETDGAVQTDIAAEVNGRTATETRAVSDNEVLMNTDTVVVTRTSTVSNNTVTSAHAVQSHSDLSAFASTVIQSDPNVDSAELANDSVSIRYKQRAKLLGVLPVSVTATAVIRSDGSVSVRYPWYGFLLSTENTADLEARLSTTAQSTIQNSASFDASENLTAQAQATLLEQAHAVMKNNLETSLAAEAEAQASAE